jgi:hypothetical protein
VSGFPGVIKGGFQNRQNAVGSCSPLADGIRASFDLSIILLAALFGSRARPFLRQTMMPVGNLSRRKLGAGDGAERRQDMRLRSPPGFIDGLAATPLVSLEIVVDCVLDGERPLPRVMTFLSPPLGAPPCPRGLLRLPIVEDGNPGE